MRKLIPLHAATKLPLGAFDIRKGFFNLSQLEAARAEAAEMRSWKSSRRPAIEAKIVGVEDKKTFNLITSAGKTIRITGERLSFESLQ